MKPENEGHTLELGVWLLGVEGGGMDGWRRRSRILKINDLRHGAGSLGLDDEAGGLELELEQDGWSCRQRLVDKQQGPKKGTGGQELKALAPKGELEDRS